MKSIEDAAIEFVRIRDQYAAAKAERNSHRCTEESSGDFEIGDPGEPACWKDLEASMELMCDECQLRVAAHKDVVRLQGPARLALPRLQRAVRRLAK